MAERPRRTARVPGRYQDGRTGQDTTVITELSSTPRKRKVAVRKDRVDEPNTIDFLLKNPKSPLVNLQLSTLINESTWNALSQDSRALLSTMLPPTVFPFTRPSLHPCHPAKRQSVIEESHVESMDVDSIALASGPNLSFLTDSFFEAAAKTFQDHLYSGWLTPAHESFIQEYRVKVKTGKSHAPWKDETWNAEHSTSERSTSAGVGLAGDGSSLTLQDIAKYSVIRVGDVLAYRRFFSQLNITVEKDALIQTIHPTTHALTVLVAPSTHTHLPLEHLRHPDILTDIPEPTSGLHLQEMTITNPTQLESALLDMDGRVEKSRRRNGNAWKCFGVWRWRDEVFAASAYQEGSDEEARGGREYQGTLFYLRGCFYDDQ